MFLQCILCDNITKQNIFPKGFPQLKNLDIGEGVICLHSSANMTFDQVKGGYKQKRLLLSVRVP